MNTFKVTPGLTWTDGTFQFKSALEKGLQPNSSFCLLILPQLLSVFAGFCQGWIVALVSPKVRFLLLKHPPSAWDSVTRCHIAHHPYNGFQAHKQHTWRWYRCAFTVSMTGFITTSSTIQGLFQVCHTINASEGMPWIIVVIYHKSDLFLRWSWLEVSDRQSALTPPYLTRPSLTHRAASQQARRWHFLEKRVRCQQQYFSFHIVTVSVGGLEEGESERKKGKVASVLPVTFCHTSLFISAFLWGGKIAENKHKGSFSEPADWLLKRSDSRNVEAINEHWKTNYSFNRTV